MTPPSILEILSQSPCYVSLMNRDGTIAWISHANYGHEVGKLTGLISDTAVLEDDRPIWWDGFRRALHNRLTVRYRLRVGVPEPPFVVTLEGRLFPVVQAIGGPVAYVGCVSWDTTLGTPKRGPIPVGLPAGAKWLSPICEKVVAYLDSYAARWIGSGELAAGCGEQNNHRFKAILSNLVDRRILEARTGAGYRLAQGGVAGRRELLRVARGG